MSEKEIKAVQNLDRRVRRTRDVLGDALIQLMQEKPFDTITVQDVLDLAGVSRSTFYTHFRDKDDLFLSDADDFFLHMANLLEMRGEMSQRVIPAREMFAHVAQMKELFAALNAAGKLAEVMELAQEHFARGIEQRLSKLLPAPADNAVSRAAQSHAFAGAFLSLMNWWLAHDQPATPGQMDETFHQMVWSGIRAQER